MVKNKKIIKDSKSRASSSSLPVKKISRRAKRCKSGKHEFVTIVYGKPLTSAMEKAKKGEIILAGCKDLLGKFPKGNAKNVLISYIEQNNNI